MSSATEIIERAHNTETMAEKKRFGLDEAKHIGDTLGIPWDKFGVEQFTMGLNIEFKHARRNPTTDPTRDEPMATGRIVLTHLGEMPDYYTQLAVMTCSSLRAFHSFRLLLL